MLYNSGTTNKINIVVIVKPNTIVIAISENRGSNIKGIIPNTVVPAANETALILLALESIIALKGSFFRV
jgi:hypothetical protein